VQKVQLVKEVIREKEALMEKRETLVLEEKLA
jgi:hypothetical protein